MAAAAAVIGQVANAGQSIISGAYNKASFNRYGTIPYERLNNQIRTQETAANRVQNFSRATAGIDSSIQNASAGLSGSSTQSKISALTASADAAREDRLGALTQKGNSQNAAAQAATNAANAQWAQQQNQITTGLAIGTGAGGLIGAAIAGGVALSKGGKTDANSFNTSTKTAVGPVSTVNVNQNTGYVAGNVGNDSSVGTTNFINDQSASLNKQLDTDYDTSNKMEPTNDDDTMNKTMDNVTHSIMQTGLNIIENHYAHPTDPNILGKDNIASPVFAHAMDVGKDIIEMHPMGASKDTSSSTTKTPTMTTPSASSSAPPSAPASIALASTSADFQDTTA